MAKYFYIALGFLALLGLLAFFDYNLPDGSSLKGYVQGVFTETIGIIATLLFVQMIFDRSQDKKSKQAEIEAIERGNRILSVYITDYKRYACQVVTPTVRLQLTSENIEIPSDFTFNDMIDLFRRSLYTTDDNEPVVLKCLKAQEKLKSAIEKMLFAIDFQYFPRISELLLNYIKRTGNHNPFDGVRACSESESLRNLSVELIREHQGDVAYQESNLINQYVLLYNLIKLHIEFFNLYELLLNEMRTSINR